MKPRLLILSAFLTPFRSGAEACAEEVALALKDQYDITIVTARLRSSLAHCSFLDSEKKVKVMRVGYGNALDKWLYPFLAPLEARKHQPQIIHAVLETFAGLALHFCRFTVPSAKRLLTLQTLNRSLLKGMIIRSAHTVTAISTPLAEIAKQFGAGDVTLIPNGIHLEAIGEAPKTHRKVPGRMLFVGRLEEMKGVDTLLRAFAGVVGRSSSGFPLTPSPLRGLHNTQQISTFPSQACPEPGEGEEGLGMGEELRSGVHLHIIGDGSQRQTLEAMAKNLGIDDCVTFLGYLQPPALYREFAEAEIFCGLSRSEALGNVFLEAMAAECAVVATNVGGIVDIVRDGQTGLLVAPDDPQVAAEAVQALLEDPQKRDLLVQAAKKFAQDFDWSQIAKRYVEVYRKLL